MEVDENLEQWENGTVSAADKRILITKWLANAWEEIFTNPRYNPRAYFERTGCLLTIDCSEDALVKLKGVPDYQVPPTWQVQDEDVGPPQSEVAPELEPDIPDEDIY